MGEWYFWVTLGLSIAVAICGGLVKKLSDLFKETGEFLTCVGVALDDGKITREEAIQLMKEAGDVKVAWFNLLSLFKK